MPADVPVAGPRVLPALLGPRRLSPFRARRLALPLVAASAGAPDRALSRPVDHRRGQSARGDVRLDDEAHLHVHELCVEGRRVRGVVGVLDLTGEHVELGDRAGATLLPHEGVDPDRVARLADRMADLALDPAPLLLVRREREGHDAAHHLPALLARATRSEPDHDGLDARGGRHRLWAVRDDGLARGLTECVGRGRLLVADGHHRLAAHLDLRGRSPAVGDGGALAMVTDDEVHAPVLAPIHRTLTGLGRDTVVAALRSRGHVVVPAGTTALAPPRDLTANQLLVVDPRGSRRMLVHTDDVTTVVEALHAALDPLLGERGWGYHHDTATALGQLEQPGTVAVLLPPASIAEAWRAAEQGRLLPAKATSFQPKPPLGVLLRSWLDV